MYIYDYIHARIMHTVGINIHDTVVLIDTMPVTHEEYVESFKQFMNNWVYKSYEVEVKKNKEKSLFGIWRSYAYIPSKLIYSLVNYIERVGFKLPEWMVDLAKINKHTGFDKAVNGVVIIDSYTAVSIGFENIYKVFAVKNIEPADIELVLDHVSKEILSRIKLSRESEIIDYDENDGVIDVVVLRGNDVFKAIRFKNIRSRVSSIKVYGGLGNAEVRVDKIYEIYKVMGRPSSVNLIYTDNSLVVGMNYDRLVFLLVPNRR